MPPISNNTFSLHLSRLLDTSVTIRLNPFLDYPLTDQVVFYILDQPNGNIIQQVNQPAVQPAAIYEGSFGGLTANTTYYAYAEHRDAGNNVLETAGGWFSTYPPGSTNINGDSFNYCGQDEPLDEDRVNVPFPSPSNIPGGYRRPTVRGATANGDASL